MADDHISRRQVLRAIAVTGAGVALSANANAAEVDAISSTARTYTFCLNMSTIRGHNLGFMKELDVAAAAGYRSVEIWMDSMMEYINKGGKLREVKDKLNGLGVKVEDCIAFNKWVVDDEPTRNAGIEQMKKDMEMLAELGCKRMAATGMGISANDVPGLNVIAERYHHILEMGRSFGVVPQLEMWGFQPNFQDVAEVTYIAMKSRHPSARVLLDVFHLYRGNSSLDMLSLMNPNAVEMFHMNDYPAGYPWQTITDADRIYPGDGIAPIHQTLTILLKNRTAPLVLSCELFNKAYYKQDALTVAKTSLAKMRAVLAEV